jgi:hypothetical protein
MSVVTHGGDVSCENLIDDNDLKVLGSPDLMSSLIIQSNQRVSHHLIILRASKEVDV